MIGEGQRPVVVTGLGAVTCLGHELSAITERLRRLQHGFVRYEPFDDPLIPIAVAAPLPDFDTRSPDPEDWVYPARLKLKLEQLRSMAPHVLYAAYAMDAAVAHAGLSEAEVSDPRVGLYTASAGSAGQTYHHLHRLKRAGVMRCSPYGIVASIAGSLNFNLVARHQIKGSSCGMVSACASSGHALGLAMDEIASGRQDRMFVVGAEDFTLETIVPFAGMRALSRSDDPDTASRPFDRQRDGFVGTGGAVALVIEAEAMAEARQAPVLARLRGWGQASDGHHVAISHPEGDGLRRAMELALAHSGLAAGQIDYVNAHATSTPIGDAAECHALKAVFGEEARPAISSTKALTGHALSLSSIMEVAFCVLSMQAGFQPGSAHIAELDPAAEGLNILRRTLPEAPRYVLSNSSGFGGANVVIALSQADAD